MNFLETLSCACFTEGVSVLSFILLWLGVSPNLCLLSMKCPVKSGLYRVQYVVSRQIYCVLNS